MEEQIKGIHTQTHRFFSYMRILFCVSVCVVSNGDYLSVYYSLKLQPHLVTEIFLYCHARIQFIHEPDQVRDPLDIRYIFIISIALNVWNPFTNTVSHSLHQFSKAFSLVT